MAARADGAVGAARVATGMVARTAMAAAKEAEEQEWLGKNRKAMLAN